MRFLRKTTALIASLLMLTNITFAEEATWKATFDGEKVTTVETELRGNVDNSDLQVNVLKQIGEQTSVIYTGRLGGYDDGAWSNVDFSDINFLILFEWESAENECIYIIPKNDEVDNTSKVDASSIDKAITDNNQIISTGIVQPSLNIQEHFYINNTEVLNDYEEQIIEGNDLLSAQYIITNNGTSTQSADLILCIYDPTGRLINIATVSESIGVGQTETVQKTLTVGADVTSCYAKVMLWDGINSLRPLHPVFEIGRDGISQEITTATISCVEDKEYILVTTAENMPANENEEYTLSYDPTKLELIDLCSHTYKKELTPGIIHGTGINIVSVDTTRGKVVFKNPNNTAQNISKVINSFKFKGIVSEEDTVIIIE